MDIYYLLKSIKHHLFAFCFTLLICVGGVFLINMIVQPQYQASASLVATITSTESGTYNELLASQMLTRTYEDAIKSRYIANEVKEKLNLSESIYDLLQRIDVRTDPGTLVIMLYATHDNPEDAVRISNAFADAFIAKSTEIVQSANVIVLDYADMEDASIPVSPRKMLNLAIGGFIGIFVALGISMLLERRRITRKGKYRKAEIEGIYN